MYFVDESDKINFRLGKISSFFHGALKFRRCSNPIWDIRFAFVGEVDGKTFGNL